MIVFVILIVLSCVALGLIVLVQNPKGGGLASSIGGFSNQFMGVKQTTDVLEKGTWIFAAIVALLCMFSSMFMSKTTSRNNNLLEQVNTRQAPASTAPAPSPSTVPLTPAK
jgi:preprotein translocase subunit SecG